MKLGIMQPYLFPYLGYWQLINVVDKFVLLDDVNFITRGFINRNSILLNNKTYRFSIPLDNASQNKLINETKLKFDCIRKEKFLKTIKNAYSKAPYFNAAFPLIEDTINNQQTDLTEYIKYSIKKVLEYIKINTEILVSSEIKKNNSLKGQDRIIEINKILSSDIYINASGGKNLYNKEEFLKHKIELKFIEMKNIKYKQYNNEFVPNLSIIDVMMFNSKEEIREMLNYYELL